MQDQSSHDRQLASRRYHVTATIRFDLDIPAGHLDGEDDDAGALLYAEDWITGGGFDIDRRTDFDAEVEYDPSGDEYE